MTPEGPRAASSFVAIDHRRLFERLVEENGIAPDERYPQVVRIKRVICEAAREVLTSPSDDPPQIGILLDEQYAATEIARTQQAGITVAMAIERNGAPRFTLEHGDAFGTHVRALQPDIVKVLFLYDNHTCATTEQLQRVWSWCVNASVPLLLEAIPVTGRTDGLADFMRSTYASGIRPYQWKIPVPASDGEARVIADAGRDGADTEPRIVLLGGSGSLPEVVDSLGAALSLDPAFTGWAVGRALWGEAARGIAQGSMIDAEARELVATNLRTLLQTAIPAGVAM